MKRGARLLGVAGVAEGDEEATAEPVLEKLVAVPNAVVPNAVPNAVVPRAVPRRPRCPDRMALLVVNRRRVVIKQINLGVFAARYLNRH